MSTISDDAAQRFATIWEHVECGIAIIDAETREILAINPVASRMFGDGVSRILGNRCHKFICPAESSSCPIMDKGQVVDRSERKFIKADGTAIPIIKSVAKIQYNGRLALLESFTDISNLKEAEKKLVHLQVTETANRAKSAFLSRMSHEMRTPMNAIIGMTKIAEGTDDAAKLKYCLSMIGVSAKHLLALINDVLDMAKIESGKFELDAAPLSVEDILAKIRTLVMEQAAEKGITLNISAGANMPMRYIGDELRLSQVITNLMSNAVKFTPSGGSVTLTAGEAERREKSSLVRFSVTDTGIGMGPEQIDKLFNIFEQGDTSISRRFGGSGLGLAITRSIVEKMNGSINVDSSPGKGSVFTVEVELAHSASRETGAVSDAALPAAGEAVPDFSHVSLLLAEDVAINQEIFASLLEATGVRIDMAANGREALEKFRSAPEKYDIIVMDVQMPGMDGYEATRAIRALDTQKARTIPIIAMTANVFREDIENCLACGMDGHLAKPIDEKAVIETILSRCAK